ncbi:MAG: molybdenum cofactor biosynthesis protein MoaE [Actinobacteria bacterium]|nr:molybdenum cofactor biosynthesis protein MoaE [Actinomycetota bacterium]
MPVDLCCRVAVTDRAIDVGELIAWCSADAAGAIGSFCGVVRDHAEGRRGIVRLDYEAHPTAAEPRLAAVADAARRRWPQIERIVLVHRVGSLVVGDVAVVVAVSTPHRDECFAATRFCIDAVKATVPIWKYEVWDGGEGWGTCAHELVDIDEFAGWGHDRTDPAVAAVR